MAPSALSLLMSAAMIGITAMLAWGCLSARLHAYPWRMAALAICIMVPALVFQAALLDPPTPAVSQPPVLAQIRELLVCWTNGAVALAGALLGVGFSAYTMQLHASAERNLALARKSVTTATSRALKDRAVIRAMVYESEEQRAEDLEASNRWLLCLVDEDNELGRAAKRLGLET